jgi:hypothetical protein
MSFKGFHVNLSVVSLINEAIWLNIPPPPSKGKHGGEIIGGHPTLLICD